MCPQTNILLDQLSATEHLELIATLSMIDFGAIPLVLEETDLLEVKEKHSSTLSLGQKRKLCLAMALI